MTKISLEDRLKELDALAKARPKTITTASGTIIDLRHTQSPVIPFAADPNRQLDHLNSVKPVDIPVEPPEDE